MKKEGGLSACHHVNNTLQALTESNGEVCMEAMDGQGPVRQPSSLIYGQAYSQSDIQPGIQPV